MKFIITLACVFVFAASIASVQAATGDQVYVHPGRLVDARPHQAQLLLHG
jgi:hypothetical protein